MADEATFSLRWEQGATAELEVFSPKKEDGGGSYRLKYTPPFRTTLRPPVESRPLGPGELKFINDALEKLVEKAQNGGPARAEPGPDAPEPNESAQELMTNMTQMGKQLFSLLIPPHVKADLRTENVFLEIGVDEELLDYPWELMHDGAGFLCERHPVGRFVANVKRRPIPLQSQSWAGDLEDSKLSVLVISVPRPQERDGLAYELLTEAEAETNAIVETLDAVGVKPRVLVGKKATFNTVYEALESDRYHIIHYNGHAHFRADQPNLSGLVLFDRDMTTGPLESFFGQRPPILCFMNACETGHDAASGTNHDIYSLARSILATGSYLVGSRWRLTDTSAQRFATSFYSSLVGGCKTIGRSVKEARTSCREQADPNDVGWASYLYYGDPRICFRRVTE